MTIDSLVDTLIRECPSITSSDVESELVKSGFKPGVDFIPGWVIQ